MREIIFRYMEKCWGSYSKNYNEVSNFINSNKHNIYFDERTFIEQVPVIKVKIIQDLKDNIHEE